MPTTFIAGTVRGFSGFGGPIVLLSALNFFLAPTSSIPIILCVDLLANILLLPDARHSAIRAITVPLSLGTFVSLPLGVLLVSVANPETMKHVIALCILAAALLLLSGWRPFVREIRPAGWAVVGMLTGIVMGATSLGITAALFLNSGPQTAAVARANFIVWVFFSDLLLLTLFIVSQGFSLHSLPAIATMAPAYLIGSLLGARLTRQIPERLMRQTILVLVGLSALARLVF